MKIIKLKFMLIVSLMLLGQQVFSQLPAIDSLKIIPENPQSGDEIKVICYATFSSGGCDLMEHDILVQGNQIALNMEYMPGAATYICHSVDTISLGILEADDYQLHVSLIIQPQDAIVTTKNADFTVSSVLGLDQHSGIRLTITPNPFDQAFQIKTDASIEKIELNTLSGQTIFRTNGLNPENKITVSDLKNGAYILVVTDNKGDKHSERIIKH